MNHRIDKYKPSHERGVIQMKAIVLVLLTLTFAACLDIGTSPERRELSAPDGELVWVGQSFVGGKQCGIEPYTPPDTKQLLNSHGIAVADTRIEYLAVCLACTCPAYAALHYALISEDQVDDAAKLGFQPMSPPRSFQYKAFDSMGTLIVQGWMMLTIKDSTDVVGEWRFTKVNDPKNIGPQEGVGTLEGGFSNGELHLNLNPGFADNNVVLSGALEDDSYSGSWMWIGFPGMLNHGSFQAARQ